MRPRTNRVDQEMVVVTRDEQRRFGRRPHAQSLTLPPVLNLVCCASSTLCQVTMCQPNNRAADIQSNRQLVPRDNECHPIFVGWVGSEYLGSLLGYFNIPVVGAVGVRLAATPGFAVIATDYRDQRRCDIGT